SVSPRISPAFLTGISRLSLSAKVSNSLLKWFAAPFPRRRDPINLSAVAAPASWRRTHNHALLVEDVEVAPLHRFDMVIATHRFPDERNQCHQHYSKRKHNIG